MEQGLAELRKIFIKKVDEVIEKAKNTNEIEASLPSVRACITVHVYICIFLYIKVLVFTCIRSYMTQGDSKQFKAATGREWL